MYNFIALLIILNVIHWLADYSPLSTKSMLAAKRIGYPYQPILLHAEVHALLMGFALAASMNYNHAYFFKLFLLIMIELITHFVIDVLKGKINVWYPAAANPANKIHWLIFGFDQLLHQLVIISIAAIAVIW